MRINTFALVGSVLLTAHLSGCQSLNSSINKLDSANIINENKMRWSKDGRVFQQPDDSLIAENRSRVIFFRDPADTRKDIPVYIGIGAQKMFQTSLKDGHYSDVVVCSGPQTINSASIEDISEDVVSYSKLHELAPQKTTYIKVGLSSTNQVIVQQVAAAAAIPQLSNTTRQSYQISRVSMVCDAKPKIIEVPVAIESIPQAIYEENKAEPRIEYAVNFDFDTSIVINNNYAKFEGLANFINLYPNSNIILEGHTDSKGSDAYNLNLSKIRAEKVKNILVNSYGVDAYQLSTVGYGEARPIDTNETELGRLNNRRVVAVVSP